jgi:hypothetical protein
MPVHMHTSDTHRIAAAPAAGVRALVLRLAPAAEIGLVDKVIAVGLIAITAIIILISLVIVG